MTCRFKDLCLDVGDTDRMARFWSAVLGLTAEPRGANARLGDGVDEHALWLNQVPEPRTVKHRVHLDVHTAAVSDLVALGATVVDTTQPWTGLTDPEGGEFCAFVRPPADVPSYRLYEVVVDAADPTTIGAWWADRFETTVQTAPQHCWLEPVAGLPWELVFAPVPEPKAGKNRLHWDVWGDTGELIEAGATVLSHDDDTTWDVLADPEGNEFCVFPST